MNEPIKYVDASNMVILYIDFCYDECYSLDSRSNNIVFLFHSCKGMNTPSDSVDASVAACI